MDSPIIVMSEFQTGGLFSGAMLIQSLGLIGAIIGVIRMQMPDHRRMMLYHTYYCVPFFFHFLLLGTSVAAIQALVGAFRTWLLAQDRLWPWRHKIAWGCFGLVVTVSLPFLDEPLALLTVAALLIGMLGEIQKNPLQLRFFCAAGTSLWLIFGLATSSWGVTGLCVISLASNLIGACRYHLIPYLRQYPQPFLQLLLQWLSRRYAAADNSSAM